MGDDHLDKEFSIEGALTESGVKASAKSRFVAAVDRLLGGILDWPASYIDGKATIKRLETELKVQKMREIASVRLQLDTELEKLEASAKISKKYKEIGHELNEKAVFIEALQDLSENKSDAESSDTIDDDWLNIFGKYAADASSDRVRILWGKVLSGEVRRPGSFSITTMRILSELDQKTATLFESVLPRAFGCNYIVLDNPHVGQNLINMSVLEELGFLQEAGGNINLTYTFDHNGKMNITSNKTILLMTGPPGASFQVNVARITRSGEQIMSFLPESYGSEFAEKFSQYAMDLATSIEASEIINQLSDGSYQYRVPARRIK